MSTPIAIFLARQLEDTHPTASAAQLLMYNAADELRNQHTEIERLRKIEAAAVAAVDFDQWQGDEWYESMMALQKALHGEAGAGGSGGRRVSR